MTSGGSRTGSSAFLRPELRWINTALPAPAYSRSSCNLEGGSGEPEKPLHMTEGQHLVLVVDDDFAVRESLKFALELEGLEVQACRGGPDLLMHPRLFRADCLILDHQMPSMGGFAVLARLRTLDCHVPVILLTDHTTDALRRRAALAGVRHIVEKPLLDSALIDSIQNILGGADWRAA
jgi:FixJ family two-component response regulator